MSSIPCDVVLLPSKGLSRKAIEASKDIAAVNKVFSVLDDENYFAHTSLYMTQLSNDSIEQAKKLLEQVSQEFNAYNLVATGYGGDLGYSDVEYPREALYDIQKTVLDAINPVRDGMRIKDEARMKEAKGVVYENFKKYGYPHIGNLLRPHITFTRLTSFESPDTEALLGDPSRFSGLFDRIGLFEMGDNGTCIRKIGEWKLAA